MSQRRTARTRRSSRSPAHHQTRRPHASETRRRKSRTRRPHASETRRKSRTRRPHASETRRKRSASQTPASLSHTCSSTGDARSLAPTLLLLHCCVTGRLSQSVFLRRTLQSDAFKQDDPRQVSDTPEIRCSAESEPRVNRCVCAAGEHRDTSQEAPDGQTAQVRHVYIYSALYMKYALMSLNQVLKSI